MNLDLSKAYLFYDSQCTLCARFKIALERINLSEEIVFMDINLPENLLNFPMLKIEDCQATLHLVKSNQVYVGGEAIKEIVKIIPLASKFTWLIESNMGNKASHFFYDQVEKLRHRHKEKCHHCKKNGTI